MCGITGREDFLGVELEKIFYVRNGRRFFMGEIVEDFFHN